MASSRLLFFVLGRSRNNASANPQFRGGVVSRSLSSGAPRSEESADEAAVDPGPSDGGVDENDDLRSRIFRLRLPKRSVTNVLQKWVHQGNPIAFSDLRHISKDLRRVQRYKHALEISEWMVAHGEHELSDSDYATRIDLINKVFGIYPAERYFEGLPLSAKTYETHMALLHSYAAAKLTDKAEDLYAKIRDSNLPFTALPFNEMMTLYMSVRQMEKVSSVVEELKCRKVEPDLFTYNLWISSCAATFDIDGVKRILDEMTHCCSSSSDENWVRYMNLVNIYIDAGRLVNSGANSLVGSKKGITQREWVTYDFLILLYASMGDKDKIDQIWKSLKMTKQKMSNRNHMCVLSSYLMLGHLKEVVEVIGQWKQSSATDFDISMCNRLLNSFMEIGLSERAETFRMLLIERDIIPLQEDQDNSK